MLPACCMLNNVHACAGMRICVVHNRARCTDRCRALYVQRGVALSEDVWHACDRLCAVIPTSGITVLRHERRRRDGTGQHAVFGAPSVSPTVSGSTLSACQCMLYCVLGAHAGSGGSDPDPMTMWSVAPWTLQVML